MFKDIDISTVNAVANKTYPVYFQNGKFYLHAENNSVIDISNLLDKDEKICITNTGKALIRTTDKGFYLVMYFNYHVHSRYSILDAMSSVKDIANLSSGISALSEHGNMFSFLEWQKAMTKIGKKPVFSFEAYVESVAPLLSDHSLDELINGEIDGEKSGCHLILMAINEQGLKNLFELSTLAYNNFYRKPHVSLSALRKCKEGVVCTSACLSGEIARLFREERDEDAEKVAGFYKGVFGENFYLEIQRHNIPVEDTVNPKIIELGRKLDIKLLAANDTHWLNMDDELAHDYLLCIRNKDEISNPSHPTFDGDGYEYFSDKDMINKFWDMPELIKNGIDLAERIEDVKVKMNDYHVPAYPYPDTFSSEEDYLSYLADEGFKKRYGEGTKELRDRLEYEKSVVLKMGYAGYFLIVWDYVSWAKSQGIAVGPGRGSAVGSVLAYCLEITDLEPTKYGLIFERFLNPERVSMPDIDMDFDYERRQEVIEYVKSKYGIDSVCNIITFNTMAAKNAVKDVARTDGDYRLGDEISKMIKSPTLTEALKTPELQIAYNNRPEVKRVIDMALKLEGMPRQTSVHACGIVISDKPIKNYMPMAMVKDSKAADKDARMLCTQVTMGEVEELGCLKMDFLGLRTMTAIRRCLETVNRARTDKGQSSIENYREIPLNDPYVYAELSEGKSFAVFQIESDGMRALMRELFADVKNKIYNIEEKYHLIGFGEGVKGPGTDREGFVREMSEFGDELFERLIAAISLYRPGPMDYIPEYEVNLKNPNAIKYDTPLLEPILKNTYGVMVYQEQVMETVKDLAGFSNAQADTIRKAMGKKKQEILDEYKPYFLHGSGNAIDSHTGKPLNIKGCIENGVSEEVASAVWDKMKDFAKYAFNKSHAAGYSVITITCAWLKHYYPVHYMCAVCNAYIDNNDKLSGYLSVTGKMGIKMLPPSVNYSMEDYSVEGDSIRFGLKGIKGMSKSVRDIVVERNENGAFSSVEDFALRVPSIKSNGLVALASCGAFDFTNLSRRAIVDALPDIMKDIKRKSHKVEGQMDLFEMLGVNDEFPIEDKPEWNKSEMLLKEKEVTGLYLSEHPLDEYSSLFASYPDISLLEDKGTVTIGCLISKYTIRYTKKDSRPMASVVLEDKSGEIKGVLFPDDYANMFNNLADNKVVVVSGEFRDDADFGKQIIIKSITPIESFLADESISQICVNLNTIYEMETLDKVLADFSGDTPVMVQIGDKLYTMNQKANPCSALYMVLQNKFAGVLYK